MSRHHCLRATWVVVFFIYSMKAQCQDNEQPENNVSALEELAERKDAEAEDDSYALDLAQFHLHPVNLNSAVEEDLESLHLLRPMQIRNFMLYKKLLGSLITVHELQAVPGWDIETIRKLLPYIRIGRDESVYGALRERWKGGDAAALIRVSQVIEKSKGFEKPVNPGGSYYLGSAQKLFLRYSYNYKQLLAYGITGEKDAGEPFFHGVRRDGFDFYSFHFFLQHVGVVKVLAIGDFTINMGQGLIHWQSMAFTKSSNSLAVKREAPCLRPYHSAGEFNFHRGVGISLEKGHWETTAFVAFQKISTNLKSVGQEELFSSFQTSGYHRTANEIADRNNSLQFTAGGNIRFTNSRFLLGLNFLQYQFSRPFQKRDLPYNLFHFKGNHLSNVSLDYHFTLGNLYLFGEFASDHHFNRAWVHGALLSLNENLDMSFLYRNISRGFESLYSDAFTENTEPANEKGLYAGLCFRPLRAVQVDLYYDLFIFPWLKYRVDGPSGGRDISVQLIYQPNKSWRLISLYRNEMKEGNGDGVILGTHSLYSPIRRRWRIGTEYTISQSLRFASRMEFVWRALPGQITQQGSSGMASMHFKRSRFSGNIAVTIFETDGYDTRLYAYEADLLYNFSLPAYYGKGIHYYINLHRDFSALIPQKVKHIRLSGWLKWGQTFYPGRISVGSGLDEIPGNRKSELKMQVLIQWQ